MPPTVLLMPAAGWVKTPDAIAKLQPLQLPAITTGSFTREPRDGNVGNTFWNDEYGIYSLNSLGLPNRGIDWLCDNFGAFLEAAGQSHLRVSIAPLADGDIEYMTERLCAVTEQHRTRITVELNLGCPNVWDEHGGQKTIISHDQAATERAIRSLGRARTGIQVWLAVKFSPITDFSFIMHCVQLCAPHVSEIVTMNTVPNAALYDPQRGVSRIHSRATERSPVGNLAGFSGKAILPIAVGQLQMFAAAIEHIRYRGALCGVGGIHDGASLSQHALAGATRFQVGSAFFATDDPGVFASIREDYLLNYA